MIGLLGGTFDPIHLGHLRLAQALSAALKLSMVRFIPAAVPPHRPQPQASAHQRAHMVSLAIAACPEFMLDTRELQRDGPSYTVNTLQALRAELGQHVSLCLLLGQDAFAGLAGWHHWQTLLEYGHIVIATRPDSATHDYSAKLQRWHDAHHVSALELLHEQPAGCIYHQAIPALPVSATAIRAALAKGEAVDACLSGAVLDYIRAEQLYLNRPC
ncbi:nicotinate-nucleotide adenylyltransferase [Pseudomethylobacillus aquaticus]|uniref:Probable nicotinate-nucleotide adenylyltransferase n=1 Tax=Pseudomethylobacillus aquaticus TaxID=2676064 RepID=A0A3N0V371_9PROT|nr:nicotinate-nucleotide adenylyltransferase [Pseudomethylobacillus aquaticus]ROH87256.1 nicotinate-nucleotide adenylyltransferase [Pseudomethylobacillus aquaticus]